MFPESADEVSSLSTVSNGGGSSLRLGYSSLQVCIRMSLLTQDTSFEARTIYASKGMCAYKQGEWVISGWEVEAGAVCL